MTRFSSLLFANLLVLGSAVSAQVQGPQRPSWDAWRVGISGAAVLNMHRGPLTTEDGLIECGTYDDASDLGWAAGNAVWIPVGDDLAVSTRLQYWKADATFRTDNDVQPFVQMADGSYVRMQSEYALLTNVDILTLDAVFQWYPTPQFYVGGGPHVGLVTRASFEQRENILQPSGIEFRNGGTERSIYAADFSANGRSAALRIALKAVAGYDHALTSQLTLSPEVGFSMPFTTVLSGSDWTIQGLQVGLTLSYSFGSPEPQRTDAPAPAADPSPAVVQVSAAPPSVAVDLSSVDASGVRLAGADVVLHEVHRRELSPLLPFVFFDRASHDIPVRYTRRDVSFTEASLATDDVLSVYHDLLNIVGDRMRRHPSAVLTIKGHREPLDGETDPGLALRRAESVRTYLQTTWGIDARRLVVAAGELPSVQSNRSVDDGKAEHRRVELSSTDPAILAYVTPQRVARTVTPASVIVAASPRNTSSTPSITIADDNGLPLATITATTLTWTPDANRIADILKGRPYARGRVRADVDGVSDERYLTMKADIRSVKFNGDTIRDSIVERYRLMFFDFDTPALNDFNGDAVRLVQQQLRTNAHVRVVGYTDRIGSAAYNKELSTRRATAVAARIKERIVPDVIEAVGAGPTAIVDNDLPEGRWYNRTVLIEVTTPLEGTVR